MKTKERQVRITLTMPEKSFCSLQGLLRATGDTPEQFIRKAIGLYDLSVQAHREGKAVGITDDAEFVGL